MTFRSSWSFGQEPATNFGAGRIQGIGVSGMARIRTIKPEFWTSEQLSECSRDSRLLFIGMWNFCDDAGRHPASALRLKMEVLPGDSLSLEEVTRWVRELIAANLIDEYAVNGKKFWEVTGWRHQRIDQPLIKYPARNGETTGGGPRRLGGKQRKLAYQKLVLRDGEVCCNCGSINNLAVDHIIPSSRGGSNELENLRLLCKPCNNEKCAKVNGSDAVGTRKVRDGDAPPEGSVRESSVREGKDISSEAEVPPSEPTDPTVLIFPKSGKGAKTWALTESKFAEYVESYPGVDVLAECRKARQWQIDNPTKRKVNVLSFLTRWLNSAQDSGKRSTANEVPLARPMTATEGADWRPS